MALYSLHLIEAERRSGHWRPGRRKRRRYLDMGAAGMMLETDRSLSKILKRKAGAELEGVGILINGAQLAAYLAATGKRSVKWAACLDPKRRFFLSAQEE